MGYLPCCYSCVFIDMTTAWHLVSVSSPSLTLLLRAVVLEIKKHGGRHGQQEGIPAGEQWMYI